MRALLFLLFSFLVWAKGFLLNRYCAHKRVSALSSRASSRLDQIEELILQMVKATENARIESVAESRKLREESAAENSKLRKSLNELIGYNQNVDRSLEVSIASSFKNYLVHILKIPETCILECEQHNIFDPKTGDIAAEWDGIFVMDYSDLSNDSNGTLLFQPPDFWPAQHTVFLLEVKQLLNITTVLEKLPKRINRTVTSLTSTDVSKKSKVQTTIAVQKARFPKDPMIVVAIGAKNVNGEVEQQILNNGYLAIRPSGKDFEVILPSTHHVKVFNASSIIQVEEVCPCFTGHFIHT